MIGGIWAAAATIASPALPLLLRRRARRGKEVLQRLPERYGIEDAPRPDGKLLWLHAASVGETVSALPLVAALPPGITTLFTTGTVTSATLLAGRLPELGLQARVLHRFVPLDVPSWAGRFLDHWRPDAACFLESELWPNLLESCRRRRIPTALINARLSARSAASWARAPGFARHVLGGFAWVAAQSETDAARLRALGAPHVSAPGNLKLAAPGLPADPAEHAALSALLGDRPRWLAASTHPADDAIIGTVHRRLTGRHPGLLTTIVPRHPERGAALAQMFAAPRRAQDRAPPPGGVWIADTLGELGLLYRCFPIVFMGKSFGGKSLADGGGQNPWEPARLGCAVATGPATQNFADAVAMLVRAGGLRVVADADALTDWVASMLDDQAARAAMGRAAALATQSSGDLPSVLASRLADLMAGRAGG
jgi:3-deoxy-D-manno-octulosonic-acid transferase